MSFLNAIRSGASYVSILQAMLSQKDFDSVTRTGNTDLMILLGSLDVIVPDDFLLEVIKRTNNINTVNNLGFTALSIAFSSKKVSMRVFEELYRKSSDEIHLLKILISPYKSPEVLRIHIDRTNIIEGYYVGTIIDICSDRDTIKKLLLKVDCIPIKDIGKIPADISKLPQIAEKVALVSESDVVKMIVAGDDKSLHRCVDFMKPENLYFDSVYKYVERYGTNIDNEILTKLIGHKNKEPSWDIFSRLCLDGIPIPDVLLDNYHFYDVTTRDQSPLDVVLSLFGDPSKVFKKTTVFTLKTLEYAVTFLNRDENLLGIIDDIIESSMKALPHEKLATGISLIAVYRIDLLWGYLDKYNTVAIEKATMTVINNSKVSIPVKRDLFEVCIDRITSSEIDEGIVTSIISTNPNDAVVGKLCALAPPGMVLDVSAKFGESALKIVSYIVDNHDITHNNVVNLFKKSFSKQIIEGALKKVKYPDVRTLKIFKIYNVDFQLDKVEWTKDFFASYVNTYKDPLGILIGIEKINSVSMTVIAEYVIKNRWNIDVTIVKKMLEKFNREEWGAGKKKILYKILIRAPEDIFNSIMDTIYRNHNHSDVIEELIGTSYNLIPYFNRFEFTKAFESLQKNTFFFKDKMYASTPFSVSKIPCDEETFKKTVDEKNINNDCVICIEHYSECKRVHYDICCNYIICSGCLRKIDKCPYCRKRF